MADVQHQVEGEEQTRFCTIPSKPSEQGNTTTAETMKPGSNPRAHRGPQARANL